MFGTLASTDFDRGTLEFIENPDPVSAVSRNLQDKLRVACISCRSRKVRCSGGRKRCQRCVAIGLECVYPATQGRNKRQENTKSRRGVIQRNENVPNRIVRNEAEPCARNGRTDYGEELALDDMDNNTFDDSGIDESFFGPWIMDSPMQHSTDSGSINVDLTTGESPFPARSPSATVASPSQLPKVSTAETSLTSLLNLTATDSAGDLKSWEGPHTTHGDMAWAMDTDGQDTVGSTSHPRSLEPWHKKRTESDGCRCLLNSISFLERLASRSASREDRIDLLLAEVRNCIETLAIFIACERCAARIEHNMLLAMAARQISVIIGKTASCYKTVHLMCGGRRGDNNTTTKSSPQLPELYTTAAAGPVDIAVSTYRVNRRERLHLLESLVTLQIAEFQQHLDTIKARYRNRPKQGQPEALGEAENHIRLAQIAVSSHA